MTDYTREEILANRRTWLAALRSGNLQQATGTLARRPGPDSEAWGYCCLGVACEVLGIEKRIDYTTISYGIDEAGWSDSHLPAAAMHRLGFTSVLPELVMPHPQDGYVTNVSLASLNDDFDFTFDQIADAIELYRFAEGSVVEGLQ